MNIWTFLDASFQRDFERESAAKGISKREAISRVADTYVIGIFTMQVFVVNTVKWARVTFDGFLWNYVVMDEVRDGAWVIHPDCHREPYTWVSGA
jgi:hypothetical protein